MSPIEREHVEFVCPNQIETRELLLGFARAPVTAKTLVASPETGNGAAIVELPAGWTGGDVPMEHAFELIVLDGALEIGGRTLGQYGYFSCPAGETCPALASIDGTKVFVDFIADVTESAFTEWEADGWQERPDDGHPAPAPGLMHKPLRGRHDGPRAFLLRIPPGWREERTEWHDCAEASIRLEGSLWLSNAHGGAGGWMSRHCYFWRPKYITHSPMHTEEGAFSFLTVDGRLINHHVETEGPPPSAS